MGNPSDLSHLMEFPCEYQVKAFGLNDGEGRFFDAVRTAVGTVVSVPLDAMKGRPSAKGSYLCVTVLVQLHNAEQLKAIYEALRQVDGLKYLL